MKYQIQQISYDCRTFQNIEECTWNFSTSEINTGKGLLKILGFQEVEQNGQVGVQMDVDGWLNLNEYYVFSPFDGTCLCANTRHNAAAAKCLAMGLSIQRQRATCCCFLWFRGDK